MRVTFQTDCQCWLRETWEVELPDDTPLTNEAVRDLALESLADGRATFLSQEASEEQDRTFARVLP